MHTRQEPYSYVVSLNMQRPQASEKLEMTSVFLQQAVWLYKKLLKHRALSRMEAAWSALSQGHADPLSLPPFHPPSSEHGAHRDVGLRVASPGDLRKEDVGGSQCPCWGAQVSDVGIGVGGVMTSFYQVVITDAPFSHAFAPNGVRARHLVTTRRMSQPLKAQGSLGHRAGCRTSSGLD